MTATTTAPPPAQATAQANTQATKPTRRKPGPKENSRYFDNLLAPADTPELAKARAEMIRLRELRTRILNNLQRRDWTPAQRAGFEIELKSVEAHLIAATAEYAKAKENYLCRYLSWLTVRADMAKVELERVAKLQRAAW